MDVDQRVVHGVDGAVPGGADRFHRGDDALHLGGRRAGAVRLGRAQLCGGLACGLGVSGCLDRTLRAGVLRSHSAGFSVRLGYPR